MRVHVAFIAVGLCVFSCATIMHGGNQDVAISSNPSGADVTVDNKPLGKTPVIAKLDRSDNHKITVALPGYAPYEIALTKSLSGWVWGNVLFGGLIGLAVDAISGGLYYLNPEQVQGELRRDQPAPSVVPASTTIPSAWLTFDGVVVAVVDHADPAWTPIGKLERR